jgi:hypothetical protein
MKVDVDDDGHVGVLARHRLQAIARASQRDALPADYRRPHDHKVLGLRGPVGTLSHNAAGGSAGDRDVRDGHGVGVRSLASTPSASTLSIVVDEVVHAPQALRRPHGRFVAEVRRPTGAEVSRHTMTRYPG